MYNIGNNTPVHLLDFIGALEEAIGKQASKNLLPMQAGDVPDTYADVTDLIADFDYKPNTPLKDGVNAFVAWYKGMYHQD